VQSKKRRRGEDTWRELVARQAQSGLSVAAFCQREGISPCSLYGWRKRLRQGDGEELQAPSLPVTRQPAPGFIDLGALGGAGSHCEIRLDLGGGVVLHLVRS
jgi:putative transposase